MYLLILVLFQALLLNVNLVFAENYYISNQGNDRNDGLSPVFPWKTIDKLNSFMPNLKPGDAVFFERGGYFSGQINLNASGDRTYPFVIGAYGEGSNPVISGAVPVKNWTVYKDGIYKAEVNFEVKNLFVNGKQMTLARYPNKGMLTVTKSLSDPNSGFTDKHLKQPNGYWNGSNARIRTENWAYEHSAIKNYFKGTIALTKPTFYPISAGWGYYLDNNLNELDTLNEWYFEKTGNKKGNLYFYVPEDLIVNDLIIEGSTFNFGIYSDMDLKNVVIGDLDFKKQAVNGLFFIGNISNVVVDNSAFSGQNLCGINYSGITSESKVNNCRFYDINGKGIFFLKSNFGIISNNVFENIGMIPGYGTSGDAFGMSAVVILLSDSNHIFKNYLYNTGHDGIIYTGRGNVVEKNILYNSLLLLNDGGAIKTYGENSKYSVWRNNFVFNVPGNIDGVPELWRDIKAHGIYLDAYSNNIDVRLNTVVNTSESGFNLYDGCLNNSFINNISYGNNVGIKFFQEEITMTGNKVEKNLFIGTNENQYSVYLRSRHNSFIPVFFENNTFYNPYSEDFFIYQKGNTIINYNLNGWKKIMGNLDAGSEVLESKEYMYSEIFLNPSDETLKVFLDPEIEYKELNQHSVYGSISVPPWFSKVLLEKSDQKLKPTIETYFSPLDFLSLKNEFVKKPLWFNLVGKNLKDIVEINAPEGFELNLYHTGDYSGKLTILPEKGKINEIIYVRFIPDTERMYYDFISVNSGIANTKIKVMGKSVE